MKNRLVAMLALVLMASVVMVSFASGAEGSKPAPSIEKITGTVTEVRSQSNADGTVSKTQAYVLVKSSNGALTMFYVNTSGCSVKGGSLSDIKVGSRVTASYDAARPVVMVNPPQFTATSITLH